jgi:hypothetical protein
VTWRLKAGIVKPEQPSTASQRLGERILKHYKNRRPLLHNGSSYCGVTLTVESRYPRKRIVESTATEERNNINWWERCDIRGRLKGYVRRPGETKALRNPYGGGLEYLHRDPASRRRRRKGTSRIWGSKIWSRVLRDSDPKMTPLARASCNCKRQTRLLVREGAPNQQTRNCQTIVKIWS